MDFMNLVKKMRDIGPRVKDLQKRVEREIVEIEHGSGKKKLRLVFNGRGEVLQINIGEELLQDKTELESLLASLITEGNEKVKQAVKKELQEIFGGISIPGLEKFF